ncbi:AMP-binding protein [Brevundimonas lenta]|uniref:3-methylmercaptopropionyl-CoA ligase n=1 Tax=Brevundimonas lenta TaxID=424796 RepID=A0A7W6JC99_9CAUL|nr:AMP-binding protein [Brevundimonas lenta]MBB4082464.1 fatty-acyl-CoA synthase [Brevundimonas lenta]
MIHGEMQAYALTLDKFLDHAAKWTPRGQVVTAREDGGLDRIGYDGLRRRSRRVTAVLLDLGVEMGDQVATLAWNTQAHVETWYAIMGMGAVCHTLNPRLTEAQLASMLARSGARILIVSADLVPVARGIAARTPSVQHILAIDAPGDTAAAPPILLLDDLIERTTEDVTWGEFPETAPCGLCFTSGTTGDPKGVSYNHRSSFLHTLRQLQADVMGISAVDSVLMVVPMFHANAWGLPFAAPAVGAKLVLPGRGLDGASLARLINAEAVTVAVGIATVWLGLIEHLDATGGETPTLKRIIVGGAPLSPALMERIETRLGVTVQMSWGMTELSPLGTCASPHDPKRSALVSGRPAIGVDLLLTDADGHPLPEQRGVEGHLRVRGSAVIERYFGETASATDDDGWFATGDLASIDADGNLAITGRAKDLIKSGGEWINPAEIEAVISEHPSVSLAAVIGRPDPKWGERPLLVVETRGTERVNNDDLLAILRGRVAPWWIPDAVIRLDRMPLASTGKIDKMRLRAEHGGC